MSPADWLTAWLARASRDEADRKLARYYRIRAAVRALNKAMRERRYEQQTKRHAALLSDVRSLTSELKAARLTERAS